jgi:filamentous hemagglutinin family protein
MTCGCQPYQPGRLRGTALAGVAMLATTSSVLANPMGGQVSAGQATISSSGQTVTIQQSTSKAVLNWASFNIAPGELTQFQQPSSSAIALNRINDVNPSTIQGSLTANGGVILVNPNGIVFGRGAQVNVASLIATTANISDSAFMNSAMPVFNQPGNPNAQIINQGTITAAQAGLVGLVAPNVENSGIITARLGKVQMASGDTFTLDLAGDGVTQVGISNAVLQQLVNNGGAVVADGGTVQLTAAAARNALDSLIVNTGVIRANSIRQQGGTIILSADTPGSVITNSGTITAQGRHKHQPGGQVSLTASVIQQNGNNNASGASGGQVS